MTQEAASYAKTLIESDTAKIRFPGCANHVIASFLEKKADDYEKSGLLLETEIRLPAETGITNPDLICALGNILDNALEACRDLDQGKVTLKTNYNKPYVSILCLNPLRQHDMNDIKHKRIPELERGIGLTILQ
jgi:sensor histidine kinase regulating citrate/malate metabolism